jgi:hypothetical protein
MPSATIPPLTSTVSSVFNKFVERLKNEKVLNPAALKALEESLANQKLDPEALRKALFTAGEPTK